MTYFNFNGKLFSVSTPVIGPDNRGFRYGDGIFETCKAVNGEIILVDEHLARLWNGLTLFRFDIPKLFSPDKLQQEIALLLQKNKHLTARIRLTVFRGDGGLYDHKNALQYIIQSWPLAQSFGNLNENGLELGIYQGARKSIDSFSNCKHNNFLPYVMAAMFAKENKLNDAIVLNQHGRICDTSIANVFMLKDNVWLTPALTEGCIAGIMRRTIIHALLENQIAIKEVSITEEALQQADEVFITNSISNMRWVKAIGNQTYPSQQTVEIHRLLSKTIPLVFC